MAWRATRSWMIALASSASAKSRRASSAPTQPAMRSWSGEKPVQIWPPLRPEAPQPIRWASKSTTS